jgi:metal-responsive CopG/Arc/MetJ family transcriptional regulator
LGETAKRFSVSLPPGLVKEFDETWQDIGYENRSRAVHDAFRGFISEAKWSRKASGEMIGAVLTLSYIEKPGLVEAMASLKHRFKGIICSNQQMFVDDNKMLEIINVKGDAMEIKKLIELLKSKKGVKHVTSSIITP